jgi:cytochrome c biogenesis protein CcdA
MKTNYKKSFLGSVLAFVLGTSCCWLTSLAVWLGGATFLTVLSRFVHEYTTIILGIALLFFGMGVYQFWKHIKGNP